MSFFDWLLVGHLFGDFLLQTDRMAKGKTESWRWMAAHVGVYMVVISAIVLAHAVSNPLPAWLIAAVLAFVAGTHVILDRRTFTRWWMRSIGIATNQTWLSIVADQIFHLLTLVVAAQVLLLAGG